MRFEQTTLDNGLQVIAELNDQAHSVAAGFFVKTGSRDESAELAGVSHFLEHMTFKGTPRRDAVTVNLDFDRVGAKHNAQTSEEDTFYHVTCLPEYLPQAFDVLSDILRPTLRGDDFETEKQVIIEEIRMYLDNPMSVAYEAAKAAHFGEHSLSIFRDFFAMGLADLRPREHQLDAENVVQVAVGFEGDRGGSNQYILPL